ncbi:pyridoxal-dependent decarboxylase [Streptomyces chartreusis]|uniref:pyridoxal-dependent decarboxylase n=1 Tax=Streptomyces chartreusis TaxID=1969 RepID=UPI0036C80AF1
MTGGRRGEAAGGASSTLTVANPASRSFKAWKVWSALQAFGMDAFGAEIDHVLDLVQRMADPIEPAPDLELMGHVSLTAVCFRIGGATEAAHRAVRAALSDEGTALLGPARLGPPRPEGL